MITVAATEFSKHFGLYRETVQREVIAVTSHDRVTGYFLSAADYQDYQHLKSLAQKSYAITELPEATINAIASSKMDKRHDHLNDLLDK